MLTTCSARGTVDRRITEDGKRRYLGLLTALRADRREEVWDPTLGQGASLAGTLIGSACLIAGPPTRAATAGPSGKALPVVKILLTGGEGERCATVAADQGSIERHACS
jgi:hypothetical protein